MIAGLTINASGCDIGIYIGHGVSNVSIVGVSIRNANQHAILVQDTTNIHISNNYIAANGAASLVCPPGGVPPPGCIPEDKPIELVGTSFSSVTNNVVIRNSADGGIGIADDGAQNPGAPLGVAGLSRRATFDLVSGNAIIDNTRGCGVVIAAYNAFEGINNVIVRNNLIVGQAPGTPITSTSGPFIGQIVVATDGPLTTINNVRVAHNVLRGSYLPGIVLHANVFGDLIKNTNIVGNVLTHNGYYPGPPNATSNTPGVLQGTTGISLVAENPQTPNPPAVISDTNVNSNVVLGDLNGVWLCYTSGTSIHNVLGNPTNPVATCAGGGS